MMININGLSQIPDISIFKMNLKNPCYIPRNHLIEDALKHANNGDMTEINLITKLLEAPFIENDRYEKYTMPSSSDERYVTYCGT